MDLYRAIKELYEQKKRLDQVIESLEELQRTGKAGPLPPQKRRGRRFMDAEARKEVSERMRRYWAMRRRQSKADGKPGSPAAPARKKSGAPEPPPHFP